MPKANGCGDGAAVEKAHRNVDRTALDERGRVDGADTRVETGAVDSATNAPGDVDVQVVQFAEREDAKQVAALKTHVDRRAESTAAAAS